MGVKQWCLYFSFVIARLVMIMSRAELSFVVPCHSVNSLMNLRGFICAVAVRHCRAPYVIVGRLDRQLLAVITSVNYSAVVVAVTQFKYCAVFILFLCLLATATHCFCIERVHWSVGSTSSDGQRSPFLTCARFFLPS